MKTIKQTIRNASLGLFVMLGALTAVIYAAPTTAAQCGGAEQTSIIKCDQRDNSDSNGDGVIDHRDSGIWGILMLAINILAAGVGVLALGGIVYGSILYTSAGGNTEQVKKAYNIFFNVGIGIVAFIGMWALLNFLIPGGAFNSL